MPEHTPAPTPSRAVYGFVLYLSFRLLFFLYLIWAVLPEPFFEHIGITCFPQRYWAVAVPVFLLTVLAIFAFITYPSLNLCMTPRIDDLVTIEDKSRKEKKQNVSLNEFLDNSEKRVCNFCCKNPKNCKRKEFMEMQISERYRKCIPPVHYLDISDVSKELFLKM